MIRLDVDLESAYYDDDADGDIDACDICGDPLAIDAENKTCDDCMALMGENG